MSRKKQIVIVVVICLLVLSIGLTYAYYSVGVQGLGNINVEASLLPKEDTKEVVQNKVVEEVKTEEKPKSLIKKFLGF